MDLTRVPGFDKSPFVTSYGPSLFVSGKEQYRITIDGTRIGAGTPSLKIDGAECKDPRVDETNITFTCSGPAFDVSTPTYVDGNITVYSSSRRFFIGPKRSRNYSYSVGIVPELLGRYELIIDHKINEDTHVNRHASNYYRNDHCASNKTKFWTYNPANGCSVDIGTVVSKATTKSSNSSYEGVKNLSSSGFRSGGYVRNNGKCFWPSKDGRGALGVKVTWVDICTTSKDSTITAESGEIYWGRDLTFRLNDFVDEPIGFTLNVEDIYGSVRTISGTQPNDWFDVKYDIGAKTIIVKARSPRGYFPE